jgi:hypothetical protein
MNASDAKEKIYSMQRFSAVRPVHLFFQGVKKKFSITTSPKNNFLEQLRGGGTASTNFDIFRETRTHGVA